jgi:invasion protein IalB
MTPPRASALAQRLGCVLWLASAPAVWAQSPPVAAAATGSVERIGDWELVCPAPATTSKPACRLIQNHAAPNGQTALLVTVLASDKAKGPVAVVSVPRGVYLAPGIEMKIDGGPSFKLLYETCDETGCHAGYKVAGDIATALKKGKLADHKVFDSKQQPVSVPVSLTGFGKALDRLAEVTK